MSMILNRLLCPCFDMTWIVLPGPRGKKHPLAIVCGGGGATKSGVKNQLQIMEYVGENGFEMIQSLETGEKLCCGLSAAAINEDVVVCVAVDGSCVVYTCNLEKQGKVGFTKRSEFVADLTGNDGSVNCTIPFLDHQKRMCVITGGDEGVCRLWQLDADSSTAGSPWTSKLMKEFKGHKGPVMAISKHPTRPWLCSGSRDGTFKVWDLAADGTLPIADVQLADGTPGNEATKKLECRGCEFTADGESAFVIQSGRAGAAHLVKWKIVVAGANKSDKQSVSFVPVNAIMCSKVPATRLRINSVRGYIGIGSSDGVVTIFRLSDMSKVSAHAAHDMPVTGLSFCPIGLPAEAAESDQQCFVLSCSVDYRLASINLSARAPIMKYLLLFLLFLFLVATIGFGVYVYNDSSRPIIIA